jgi:hypothetical protein
MIEPPAGGPVRVLIVGAGRRVRNNFLPALAYLAPDFAVAGIVSPTPTRRSQLAAQWNVAEYASIDQVDLSQVDVVAISIPTAQNAAVVQQLKPAAARLKLIIDTPIAWNFTELSACSAALAGFKHVAVAEDFMNLPPYTLMRRAVDAGLIGTPKSLILNNTGYFYHGLALIRSFVDFKPVIRSRRMVMSNADITVLYNVGGMKATVVGPYRRNLEGSAISGTKGAITQYETDIVARTSNIYYLRTLREDGYITGYEIDGLGMALALPEVAAMRAMDFPDKSEQNVLRGWGLMQIFKSLNDAGNLNCRYTARQAFYDSFVSRIATLGLFPFDPFAAMGNDALTPISLLASLGSKLKRG